MGRFVVFEGGEASGKSTQARLLAERWGAALTFEPGDTAVGARLRAILLDPATGNLDPRAEALLMAADRAHHVATRILPALNRGRDVVCDRYVGSSMGFFWSVVFPFLNLVIYMFVFSLVLRTRFDDSSSPKQVALWMLAGIQDWGGFAQPILPPPQSFQTDAARSDTQALVRPPGQLSALVLFIP